MSLLTTRRPHLRRSVRLAAALGVAALALTACGQGEATPEASEPASAPTETGPVTIRFSWWGSDTRHQLTQRVIEAFQAKYPNITVQGDFTDWGGYWDKLATSIAADDAPDVITQEERYLRDYATRGVLLDLSTVEDTLDLSNIDPSVVESASFDDGTFGVPTGVNAYAVFADPAAFEAAGVELPDDKTWTWDDYLDIATKITASTGGTIYGTQDYAFNEPGFSIYARQQGQNLYDENGEVGYDDELLAEWWQLSVDLRKAGGQPDGAKSVEVDAAGPEGSLLGTQTGAMGVWWTNQLGAISTAAGRELKLLRFPGESEHERTGMYFKPAMYYSIAKSSKHPQAAAQFIDFLVNSEEAGEILLSDRGLPANLEVREAVKPKFSPVDQQAADFLSDLQDEIVDGVPVPPVGSGEVATIIRRINQEVLFDRLTPEQAAEQFTAEVKNATS
ncbi:ABC transporter substrate-binding protein [Cellulomonas sp. NS3]|uniref:ABC transporter substrate-binding protein n=1 Tax=Cellulomonas sp. NS3 TaxID=2973977 RepID=UPI002163A5A4|nr:sugar ABC transporter substrate-binding protein [Cellulomonas sp. NS3]